jgi:hypothetical protein
MVTQHSDLRALERKAFSRFYEDGLFDLLLGAMLLVTAIGFVVMGQTDNELLSLGVMLVIATVLVGSFSVVRNRVVRPRLGEFLPGPRRRRRIGAMRVALLVSCAFGVIAFALAAVSGPAGAPLGIEVVLPVVWFLNAIIVMAIMAAMLDVPRLAVYGVLFGLVGPLLIWPDVLWGVRLSPLVAFSVAALPMLIVGTVKLVRFLHDYPVREEPDGGLDSGR